MNDQRSLTDQLRDAVRLCNEARMYDAADAIERTFFGSAPRRIVITDPASIERLIAARERLAKPACDAAGGGVDDAAVAPGEGIAP